MNTKTKEYFFDVLCLTVAGIIVGTAYYFFQNSNGFAPGGVGGLATITHHFLEGKIDWSILMIAFNLPIFILVSIIVNKKLGLMLSLYMIVQLSMPIIYNLLGAKPYCLDNNGTDFNIVFTCIINKCQIGEMMKILKSYPDTFASFEKVNEVFGNFKRKV
jgi:uncharacterized membrane-anchored protein YitT (DUF2179 family)